MADGVTVRERGALPARPARRFPRLGRPAAVLRVLVPVHHPADLLPRHGQPPGTTSPRCRTTDLGPGSSRWPCRISIEISLVTRHRGRRPRVPDGVRDYPGRPAEVPRTGVSTFSGVASNFAGIPLALAFVFTLGQLGVVTTFLRETFGFNIYDTGFKLSDKLGLELVYLYFQIPLMILIIAPAIDGLKRNGARPRRTWALRRRSTGGTWRCRSSPRRSSGR